MHSRFYRTALVLGLVTAVGPFAVDMYLPALPSIGQSLKADAAAVQLSLTAYFIAIGVCQLAYGPLSDMFGRKLPLYVGLALFALGSVGCALAPDVEALIGFRVLQAMGACAGMVVPRAIVRDLHTGPDAARLMSMLMLVVSVSPILAPLSGSLIIESVGWRGVFWAVTAAAAVAVGLLFFGLKETRPAEARAGSSWSGALAGYRRLLVDPGFMGLTLIGAFGVSSFFVYLANSSFVMIDHFGLSPRTYSVLFAINAISFFGASQMTGRLAQRYGFQALIRTAATGFALTVAVLGAVMALGAQQLVVLVGLLFVANAFLGLVIPSTAVMAMDAHGEIAGAASALMGCLHLVVGAAVMAVAGLFADGTPLPMALSIAACGVVAYGLTLWTLRPAPAEAAAE